MGQTNATLQLRRASDLVVTAPADAPPWSLTALRGRLTELVGGSRSANLSVAARLIAEAQRAGEFVAWVATHRDVFFPPDVAAAGADLAALPLVWAVPELAIRVTQPVGDEAAIRCPGKRDQRSQRDGTLRTPIHGRDRTCLVPTNKLRDTYGSSPEAAPTTARDAPTVHDASVATRSAERLLRSGAFGLVVIDLARDLVLAPAAQGRLLRLAEQHDAQVLILRRRRDDGVYSGSLVSVRAESSVEQIGPGRFRATITNTKDKREGPGWTTNEEFDGPPGMY